MYLTKFGFVLLFIATSICSVYAQTENKNSKFLVENGEYVQLKYPEGSISSEGYMLEGEPEGWWKSYDKQGNIISEGNRVNSLLEGIWTFYEKGNKVSEITYVKDKKSGIANYYYPTYRREDFFINDILNGYRKEYDTSEFLIRSIPFKEGKEHGLAKEYDKNGDIILLTTYQRGAILNKEHINRRDSDGKRQGLWKALHLNDYTYWEVYYLNDFKNGYYKEYDTIGNIVKIEKYENGNLIVDAPELAKVEIYTEYYSNGKPKLKVGYKNGKPEGICREYDSISGKVISGIIFKDGEIVGGGIIDDNGYFQDEWKEYYPDGTIKCEGRYKKGSKSGQWSYYYPDGTLEQQGSFTNGKYDGFWIWYYPNGEIRIEQEYYNGLPDGQLKEFDENRVCVVKGNYIEGLEEGLWEYFKEGEREIGKYKSGEKSGLWKSYWNEKGKQLSFRGSYIDGLANGTHYYYWENGNIREEIHYLMGSRVGTNTKYDETGQVLVRVTYNRNGEEIRYNGKRTLTKEEESDK